MKQCWAARRLRSHREEVLGPELQPNWLHNEGWGRGNCWPQSCRRALGTMACTGTRSEVPPYPGRGRERERAREVVLSCLTERGASSRPAHLRPWAPSGRPLAHLSSESVCSQHGGVGISPESVRGAWAPGAKPISIALKSSVDKSRDHGRLTLVTERGLPGLRRLTSVKTFFFLEWKLSL